MARAGEIGLLLIESNYESLVQQKHHNVDSLLMKMKNYFEMSPFSPFVQSWESYFISEGYIDIKELLSSQNYTF